MIPVTLLIPCYNAGRFLPRLMGYVREQTVPFARILCYDDGSTDDTVAVARSLGLEIVTPNPNRGVAHARNQLAARVTTEWLHFHDADDRIAPEFLARLGPWCDEATDVACCDADWVYEGFEQLTLRWRYDAAAIARDAAAHLLQHPLGLNNSIIRRTAWERVGGCDEALKMWEDADVHFRLALAGARFRHRAEVLTWSLRRGDSFSHDYRTSWRCRLSALERYAAEPRAARLRAELAGEAERAAAELLQWQDRAGAQVALGLCRRLGHRAPTTNHPLLRVARTVLPPLTVLRLREWFRRRAAASAGNSSAR
jgi:glycosyltransferase involved in cell wall biosynthesis